MNNSNYPSQTIFMIIGPFLKECNGATHIHFRTLLQEMGSL